MKVKCKYCNIDFDCSTRRYNFNLKKGFNLCCSKECGYKIRNKNISKLCDNCGIIITKSPSEFKKTKSGNHFCSKSCAVTLNNKLYKTGNNHPNYKLGKGSYRNYKLNNSCKKCENCGIQDIRVLQVHHIDKDRNNNELNNLKLLCANCHLIEHSIGNQTQGESPHLG